MLLNPPFPLPKKKNLLPLAFPLAALLLIACSSTFDPTQTSVVYGYNAPKVQEVFIKDNKVSVKLTLNLNTSENSDFYGYWILLGKKSDSIYKVKIEKDFTNFSQIPLFYATTPKPSLSGNFVEPLTFVLSSKMTLFNTYKVSAIAWGYNKDYAKIFKNNGWLYSAPATPITFHFRKEQSVTLSNNSGFFLDPIAQSIKVIPVGSDPINHPTTQVNFFQKLQNGKSASLFATSRKTQSRIISWGAAAAPLSKVIELPQKNEDYYPPAQNIPTVVGHVYLLKNIDNTYAKFIVEEMKDVTLAVGSIIKQVKITCAFTTAINETKL